MYVSPNYKTKKALREAVSAGEHVIAYQPGGMFDAPRNGDVSVEGPHGYHRWYARVRIIDGTVVKVLS